MTLKVDIVNLTLNFTFNLGTYAAWRSTQQAVNAAAAAHQAPNSTKNSTEYEQGKLFHNRK